MTSMNEAIWQAGLAALETKRDDEGWNAALVEAAKAVEARQHGFSKFSSMYAAFEMLKRDLKRIKRA